MKQTVLSVQWIPQEVEDYIKQKFEPLFPSREKLRYTPEEVLEQMPNVDYLLVMGGFKVDKAVIDAGCKLKAACSIGVGYDNIDYKYAGEKGIYVLNAPTAVTQPTAELTISLMLAVARNVVGFDKELRQTGRCSVPAFGDQCYTPYGKTLGIVGFGRIGKAVAHKAKGLGMEIQYCDTIPADSAIEQALGAKRVTFEELLKTSDYVSLHCPYFPENRHLIDKAALEMMKPTAFLINAARGPLMDELALAEALRTGRIKGAALDVYENEPVISPEILALDNVVLTPHVGTYALEVRINMAKETLGGIFQLTENETPKNAVNLEYFPK